MTSSSQPPLVQWTSQAKTRDGTPFRIRPLRPDDRSREIAFLESLSERTRYFRLQRASKVFPPTLIDLLMDVDYERRMAFVATVGDGDGEHFIAVARYGGTDEPGEVELGIAVTDAWQGRGVGQLLAVELMRYARQRGFWRVSGVVLPENDCMLSLAKSLGFSTKYDSIDHVMRISRELAAVLPHAA
jgi:RimJ/RimL family protein N-acetyltransferase